MSPSRQNSIKAAWDEISSRASLPIWSMTFYRDLIIAVLLVGGCGVWYSVVMCWFFSADHHLPELSAALFTFFPALIAPALLEMTQEKQPYMRSFSDLLKVLFLTLFLICVLIPAGYAQFWVSLLSAIFTIVAWWVFNGNKPCYQDIIIPEQSTTTPVDLQLNQQNSQDIQS